MLRIHAVRLGPGVRGALSLSRDRRSRLDCGGWFQRCVNPGTICPLLYFPSSFSETSEAPARTLWASGPSATRGSSQPFFFLMGLGCGEVSVGPPCPRRPSGEARCFVIFHAQVGHFSSRICLGGFTWHCVANTQGRRCIFQRLSKICTPSTHR